MWEGITKKWVKKTKKEYFTDCRPWHSAKRDFAECQGPALGKDPFFAEGHMSGFQASDVAICSKPSQFFTIDSTCDNTMP